VSSLLKCAPMSGGDDLEPCIYLIAEKEEGHALATSSHLLICALASGNLVPYTLTH
jgi:hypothetical protein